jgi:hypothetical protein
VTGVRAEAPAYQLIAAAAESLTHAQTLFLQPAPRNLDIACGVLAKAIAQVTTLQTILTASPSQELAAAVAALRRETDLVSALLEHAAAYHVNLMQSMIEAADTRVPPVAADGAPQRLFLEA